MRLSAVARDSIPSPHPRRRPASNLNSYSAFIAAHWPNFVRKPATTNRNPPLAAFSPFAYFVFRMKRKTRSTMNQKNILAGLLACGLCVSSVSATERFFTYTYEPETLPQGAWEYEQWVTL